MQLFTRSARQTQAGVALESFFGVFAARFGQRLAELFREDLLPGETMPDFTFVLRLFGRRLARLRQRVEASDVRLGRAVLAEKQALEARDGVLARLRAVYVQLRQLVGSLFGRAGLLATALDGKPARRNDELLRQSENVVAALDEEGFVEPVPLHGSAMGFRTRRIRQQLGPLVEAFDKSLWSVEIARRQVQAARYRRSQAFQELSIFYLWSGRTIQAICHMLGESWLAERTHKPMRELDRKARPSTKGKAVQPATVSDATSSSAVQPATEGDERSPMDVLPATEGDERDLRPVLSANEGDEGISEDVPARKEPGSGSSNRVLRTKRRDLAARSAPGEVHRRLAAPKKSRRGPAGSEAATPGASRGPNRRRSTLTEGVRSGDLERSTTSSGANRAKVRGKGQDSGIRARFRRLFARE